MERHTSKQFDQEINTLGARIHAMGKLCEWQLAKAINAFNHLDKRLADEVIKADEQVNALHRQAEEEAIAVLARRQPVAMDLRYIVSVIKIATDFERIGDYAANISKRVILLQNRPADAAAGMILDMDKVCRAMINNVLDAFNALDEQLAVDVWNQDDELDRIFFRFMNTLKKEVGDDGSTVEKFADFIFIGRCCERVGDHITNVAENIYYTKTGNSYLSDVP